MAPPIAVMSRALMAMLSARHDPCCSSRSQTNCSSRSPCSRCRPHLPYPNLLFAAEYKHSHSNDAAEQRQNRVAESVEKV